VIDKKPDLITISVGVNDVWHGFYDNHPLGDGPRGVPLEIYRQKVEEMIDVGKKSGARVIVLSTTVIHENLDNRENAKLRTFNQALRELAAKRNCLFIDLFGPFSETIKAYQKRAGASVNLLTGDGVHMNAAGNHLMAYTILRGFGVSERDLKMIKGQAK
jgi:lysophospholipase L1-like esterase